jgi:hypothetical protein
MGKVYITQEIFKKNKVTGERVSQFDLSSLKDFGEPVVLLPPVLNLFAPVPIVRTLREKLIHFNDDDYLVPLGDPSIMVAAAIIAGERNGGRVRILKWERDLDPQTLQRTAGHYVAVQIDSSGREL